MRIAIVAESFLPKVDGIVNTLCRLLEYLDRQGHEALVLAPSGAPSRFAGHRVIGLPALPMPFYPELRVALPTPAALKALLDFQPDLVHLANPMLNSLVAGALARARGLPVVASYHTDVPGFARRWGLGPLVPLVWAGMRLTHRDAQINLCPSRATAAELSQHGFGSIAIWGRGVDARRFHPERRSEAWRIRLSDGQPERPLLLYVGRLSPEKRVDWIAPLLEARPEIRLAIVGDGPARGELERRFDGLPAHFCGYLRGDDLAAAYASADFFVFPGANETLGNVVLEAMASGLPVVAPAAGGVLEHVRSGETGLLFEADDIHGLVASAIRLLDAPQQVEELAAGARRHAESCTWDAVMEDLLGHYAALTPPPPRPATGRRRALGSAFADRSQPDRL